MTSQPQQASPDLGSCTQVSRPPRQNLGQSVPGRSDTRPFSLPGGGSALRRWPGTRGGVGAAGGTDAQPPRVWVSVEALSETAFPVEAPRSPQSGTNSRSGRCRPKRLSAPQSPPLAGWPVPSTRVLRPLRDLRSMGKYRPQEDGHVHVCASYDGYSTSGFLPAGKALSERAVTARRVPGGRVHSPLSTCQHPRLPVPVPWESRPLKATSPSAHRQAAHMALKSRRCSRGASLLMERRRSQPPPASLLCTRNAGNESR